MTPRQARSEISNFVDLLLYTDIAIRVNSIVCVRSGTMSRVTWRPPSRGQAQLIASEFASVSEYCGHLQNQAYSAILFDGALLQISYGFTRNALTSHRLCYYPCPFALEPEELLVEPLLDVMEVYKHAGADYLRLRSPVRFDYAPDHASEEHPASHAHMLWPHCRCAVVAPLSLGHFARFVFSHFYPELWKEHEFLRSLPQQLGPKTITANEEAQLHFSCRR